MPSAPPFIQSRTNCSSLWTAQSPPTGRHTRPSFTQRKRMLLPSFFSLGRTGGYRQVFLQGAPHSSFPLPSTSSVKQREQLGTLISALTLQGFYQRLLTAHLADQSHVLHDRRRQRCSSCPHTFEDLSIEVCTADLAEAAPNRAACSSSQEGCCGGRTRRPPCPRQLGSLTSSYGTSFPAGDNRSATNSKAS
jgi:hypothetical protein